MKINSLITIAACISCVIFGNNVSAQQKNNILDETFKSLEDRNKQYGEKSLNNAIEIQRQIFVSKNLTQEEIYFNKIKSESRIGLQAIFDNQFKLEGLNYKQAENFIDDFLNEIIKCQKESWDMMPNDLKQHIIKISSSGFSIQLSNKMAMEDYRRQVMASGKPEVVYITQVESWAKKYRLCEKNIDVSVSKYKK
jgi:hypothetical protein